MKPSRPLSDFPIFPPASYFPLQGGRYTVSPSLHRFGTDFGNGPADNHLFQIDQEFFRFRENKMRCRRENPRKYVCEANLPDNVHAAAVRLLRERLVTEHPFLFSAAGSDTLHCRLTGETLHFDLQNELTTVSGADAATQAHEDALDALCCQFPEDIAIICRDPDTGRDWLAKLHLCAPSHWAGGEKIGRTWEATHEPVPGMEKSRNAASSLVGVMIERAPAVRFTWGIEFDDRLNHHPDPPPTEDSEAWNRRCLNPDAPDPLFLRVERQVIWGMPEVNAALFTIRICHTQGSVLRADTEKREALRAALLSMSEESRLYKGLAGCFDEVLAYLCGPDGAA